MREVHYAGPSKRQDSDPAFHLNKLPGIVHESAVNRILDGRVTMAVDVMPCTAPQDIRAGCEVQGLSESILLVKQE